MASKVQQMEYRGRMIVRSGATAVRIVGIAKQDAWDNDYLLFSTFKAAKVWLDCHADEPRYQ